jgi:hypothetical protein
MSDAFHNEFWAEPDWLSDGDIVWLPIAPGDGGKTRVLKCRVAVAAGHHARIVCASRGVDRWVRLSSLLVPPDDPHHPNQRDARLLRPLDR